jgi:arylsulfatase A-like enzyme
MTGVLKQTLTFVVATALAAAASQASAGDTAGAPNILFVFADQWRADALGYAGDPNVKTPNLDRLADQAVNFTHAVSACPVCCPYRATMMTGGRPLSHGVFLNDVQLPSEEVTIAEVLAGRGYRTAYIGKWHLDGHGRSSYIPPERRQGFEYFKALECTHNYNRSYYYQDDDPTKREWQGYDTEAQTADAIRYLRRHAAGGRPFLLMLSWGPPHNPYQTAPERFRAMYRPEEIRLRPNVPPKQADVARRELAGYYAHCTALDECVGKPQHADLQKELDAVLRRKLQDSGDQFLPAAA